MKIINDINSLLFENNEAVLYLSRRYYKGNSFFISISSDSFKTYVEREISEINCCDFVMKYYNSEELIKGSYAHCIREPYLPENISNFSHLLRKNFYVNRTDGQTYYCFKEGVTKENIELQYFSGIPEYQEWLSKTKGEFTWLQCCEKSCTVYCKDD